MVGCRHTIRTPTPSHSSTKKSRTANPSLNPPAAPVNVAPFSRSRTSRRSPRPSGARRDRRPRRSPRLHAVAHRDADRRGDHDRHEAEHEDRDRDRPGDGPIHGPHRFRTRAGSVPVTASPVSRRARDGERAAERGHPVPHDLQALLAVDAVDIEARAAVVDREGNLAGSWRVRSTRRPGCMSLGVLERLDAAEVDRRLDRPAS